MILAVLPMVDLLCRRQPLYVARAASWVGVSLAALYLVNVVVVLRYHGLKRVARPAGIEPATPAFGGQYSIH